MKYLCLIIVSLFVLLNSAVLGQSLKLVGNVGGYDVEMYLDSSNYDTGELYGKYRYLSQKEFLTIEGKNYGEVISIEEFYKNKKTGEFLLEYDSIYLNGWWISETKTFPVELKIEDYSSAILNVKGNVDLAKECSSDIPGIYRVDYVFINDYFASEDNPVFELGHNGGSAKFEYTENGDLKFEIEMVCGPTYHFAIAEGIAYKKGDKFVYVSEKNEWDDELCEIEFTFTNKKVYAVANHSYACGFGARAYIDDELIKVADF
ncbi:MAG: hypothetical protein JXR36_13780 [Bacteroidales bacterium]|nr:hypothetical protein [Bacteroidales bacterium]